MNEELNKARAMLGCPFPEPENKVDDVLKITSVYGYAIFDSNSAAYFRNNLHWPKDCHKAVKFNTWDEANKVCENVAGHILIVPLDFYGNPLPGAKPPTAGAAFREQFLKNWNERKTVMLVKSR